MSKRVFVGFGFGAIQAGLFLYEAFRSGNFSRLVVAEVMPDVIDSLRKNGGRYSLNVATAAGVECREITGIEIFNSNVETDRKALIEAIAEASEIGTALPSVKFYGSDKSADVVSILAEGLRLKVSNPALPKAVIYTAENHNHAAEILNEALLKKTAGVDVASKCEVLNTVIGKMSGIVTDPAQIAEQDLIPVVSGMPRAFLVEEFNRILITRIRLPDFKRGIEVFEEKDNLLPFEEAKLYGHNATHALIGYLLRQRGFKLIADAAKDKEVMQLARDAFVIESGKALCRKHSGVDKLFTAKAYAEYADDLLKRMVNPHLRDTVERITRDPRRKLGWNDRLVGTMRIVLEHKMPPWRFAIGAAAALRALAAECGGPPAELLDDIWREDCPGNDTLKKTLQELILKSKEPV